MPKLQKSVAGETRAWGKPSVGRLAAVGHCGPGPEGPLGSVPWRGTWNLELAVDYERRDVGCLAQRAVRDHVVTTEEHHGISTSGKAPRPGRGGGGLRLPARPRSLRPRALERGRARGWLVAGRGDPHRLIGAVEGAVAIVISQDGGVRFVAQKGGRVVYWELD